METVETLSVYIENGNANEAKTLTQKLLGENIDPNEIIQKGLIAGLNNLGERFARFEAFVPELMVAGMAAQETLKILKPRMAKDPLHKQGPGVVIGTVEGDVHDVGKNIVGMMLEGGGLTVIDLGVDVSTAKFIDAVKKNKPSILALSALYSPTRLAMKDVMEALSREGLRDSVKVMVGGAPVDQEFCDHIGADGYASDAPGALKVAQRLVKVS
jgi:5-methyltetrahydrofolate--homocysteine methyltransferase